MTDSILACAMRSQIASMQFHPDAIAAQTAVVRFFAETTTQVAPEVEDTEFLSRCKDSLLLALKKLQHFNPQVWEEQWVGNALATIGQRIADLEHVPCDELSHADVHISPTDKIPGPGIGFLRRGQPTVAGEGGAFA